jgi:DNA-binding NarL/FixJ family response regulator
VILDVHAGRRVFPPEILAAIKHRAGQPALTSREVQVLELLAEGKRTKEIAAALGVTTDTANAHIKNIYSKFAVHGRGAAISEAIRRGFIRRERSTSPA